MTSDLDAVAAPALRSGDTPSAGLPPIFGDRSSLGPAAAGRAVGRCAARTAVLLLRRRLRQPRANVGSVVRFADGTSAAVYRETVIDRGPTRAPTLVVVCFRLRLVRGPHAHAVFRAESVLNTALFAGFPGLVSKLWLRDDEHGVYRGLYEWDDPALALGYVNALWWVLALVSVPGSIRFVIVPGKRRDEAVGDFSLADLPGGPSAWWRPTARSPGPVT